MNFIFYLVDTREGPHGDFSLKDGRPLSGWSLISNIHTCYTLIPSIEQFMYSTCNYVLFFLLFCHQSQAVT